MGKAADGRQATHVLVVVAGVLVQFVGEEGAEEVALGRLALRCEQAAFRRRPCEGPDVCSRTSPYCQPAGPLSQLCPCTATHSHSHLPSSLNHPSSPPHPPPPHNTLARRRMSRSSSSAM